MRLLFVSALAVAAAIGWAGTYQQASGEPAPSNVATRDIPQSLVLEHQDTLDHVATLARRSGAVGAVARRYMTLFQQHTQREREYILPPLVLLGDLATRAPTQDDAWAMTMADRVKADQDVIFEEHTQITTAANELLAAGQRAHDQTAIDFAEEAVRDSLNDLEIQEPAVLLLGAYLHSKLGP